MEVTETLEKFEFQAFGVNIGLVSNDLGIIEKIKEVLPKVIPDHLILDTKNFPQHFFKLERIGNSEQISVTKNVEESFTFWDETRLIEYVSSQIRITVAEFAESRVFIHAGAVSWKGHGIIIPGRSYSGKTTLVSELIRAGAEYYSDEYAVLDERGFLHPYAKMLSMRGIISDFDQLDIEPEEFGAKIGVEPVPVKLILLTEFEADAPWSPELLKPGEGVLEILQNTIPIRFKPEFVLNVLNKTINRAIIAKSKRDEAKITVPRIIDFIKTGCNW